MRVEISVSLAISTLISLLNTDAESFIAAFMSMGSLACEESGQQATMFATEKVVFVYKGMTRHSLCRGNFMTFSFIFQKLHTYV